ncbi:Nucleoporin nup85, partial [Massospora cicadina]
MVYSEVIRLESGSSALNSSNSTHLADALRVEFLQKSALTFTNLNRLFQVKEAMLLFALNFPSDTNAVEDVEESVTLKDIEAASDAYLEEAKKQLAIIEVKESPGQEEGSLILRSEDPIREPFFGAYFVKCAMRGLNSSVVSLLQMFPDSPLVTAVRNLVQAMPRYTAASKATFPQVWGAWKMSCQDAASEHLGTAPLFKDLGLVYDLLKIMSGRCDAGESVFDLLSFYCETWQELLGAVLLFHFPTMAPHRVDLLTNDLVEALKHAHSVDPWLSVHLSDLVEKRTLVERFQPCPFANSLADFKEGCIVEYVTQNAFIKDSRLFLVGANYLAECPKVGRDHLCKLLPSIPFEDIPSRDRALALCQELFLLEPLDKVCRSAVLSHLEAHEFSHAVKYLSKMSTVPALLLYQLAMSVISSFLSGEEADFQDLCAAILSSGLSSLEFICQYFEFHALYKEERFTEAARRLKDLILHPNTPSFMLTPSHYLK